MPIYPACQPLIATCPLSAQTQHIPRWVLISTQLLITQPAPTVHGPLYIPTDSTTQGKCLPMRSPTIRLTTAALIVQTCPPHSPTDSPSVKTQISCSLPNLHQLFPNQAGQVILMLSLYLWRVQCRRKMKSTELLFVHFLIKSYNQPVPSNLKPEGSRR